MFVKYLCILALMFTVSNAKMFQSISEDKGTFVQKGNTKLYCPNCGMNLPKFYKTNHIHKNHQYCSLHCLAESNNGKKLQDAKVVDTKSLKFIGVKNAYYVVNSTKKGTMSVHSKYAFAKEKDVQEFRKKYGGQIVDFAQAYELAKIDLKKDTSMINTKRQKKVYKVGKKLYLAKCNKVNPEAFESIASLKAGLKSECKISKDKALQAVAVYLWDTQKLHKKMGAIGSIKVPKDAKCPICGMFVHKYPKWAAMIDADKKLYFDGVKDMIKYIFSHKEDIDVKNIYITDYFSTTKIKAKDAYFVFGSNVYGPMGNELIPFSSEISAYAFKKDHFGKKVLTFYDIDQDVLEEIEEL